MKPTELQRRATIVIDAVCAGWQPVTTHGRGMTVWRKGADGRWKCVLDTWNDAPAGKVP